MTDFAVELLKRTPLEASIVISPLSMVAALSILERGAGGDTKSQIAEALKRTSDVDVPEIIRQLTAANGIHMAVATKLYLNDSTTINEDYNNQVLKEFDVTAECIDFRNEGLTVETVNKFVSEATSGMLEKLLSDDFSTADMKAFLVNAVYFKGQWAEKFPKDATHKQTFHGLNGDREVSFMTKSNMRASSYFDTGTTKVLGLPYKNENYKFIIFLPSENVPFTQFREEFTGDKIRELVAQVRERFHGVNVTIPKFKMSSSPEMKKILQELGITALFRDGDCDLRGISPEDLYVEDVIHKAVIEVNEEGTEAAAVTGTRLMYRCASIRVPQFLADRPFIYGIFRDNEPIFIGQYC